jgi:hybrid cluster-associated redox disulfide protein
MAEVATERRFTPEMIVGDALALHPNARWVFASYHLGGCTHCAVSNEETLAQVAEGYGISLEKLLGDLNSLLIT